MFVAQILADAASSQQTVNVIAGIATLMQGYISLKTQSEKAWQWSQEYFFIIAKKQNYII